MTTTAIIPEVSTAVHYRTIRVGEVDIFYREAGSQSAPALLLLHGFPTSSSMFRNEIRHLARSFHVIAPDYPGYGFSSMPDVKSFSYTFENLANVMLEFTEKLELGKYIVYLFDYGAPVGLRMALKKPEKIAGLIVQNGNAYEEGLREFWTPMKDYWKDPTPDKLASLFVSGPGSTKWQYANGVPDQTLLDPSTWTLDQARLDRPGNAEIQLALLYDYRTNVPLYPEFQAFFRKFQPPTLIVWGKNDTVFPTEGALPYKRDLPNAELHLLDTGHFALETHGHEVASHIEEFFSHVD
jgi:pimeloyl-ACP methyl ester carboxylesterase